MTGLGMPKVREIFGESVKYCQGRDVLLRDVTNSNLGIHFDAVSIQNLFEL